jgi:uncharacterized damage-inducible protein DinB
VLAHATGLHQADEIVRGLNQRALVAVDVERRRRASRCHPTGSIRGSQTPQYSVAEALHHGNVHREQICAILTSLGAQPPDIQPWGFADDTGRSRTRDPND